MLSWQDADAANLATSVIKAMAMNAAREDYFGQGPVNGRLWYPRSLIATGRGRLYSIHAFE
jgi:hypothetical protein